MLTEESQQLFKKAMSNYPTGVTVVTTTDHKGEPVGLIVNSFTSVSMDPLKILWAVDHNASSSRTFQESEKFAVHLLADDQQELIKRFSTKDMDRFNKIEWDFSDNQLPIIEGAFTVLECETFKTIEAGDHTVKNIQTDKKNPMLYHRRQIGSIPSEFYTPTLNQK